MSDLRPLHDAFAELERRADAAGAYATAPKPRRAFTFRLVPVAATVVAVAGLAAGAVWLSPGNDAPPGNQAAAPPTTSDTSPTKPKAEVPTTPDELADRFRTVLGSTATFDVTETAGGPVVMTMPPPPSSETTQQPPEGGNTPPVPTSVKADDGGVLPGAFIKGSLTASGVKGGYDLQIYAGTPGDQVWCDDPDKANCSITTLPDGSQLAIGQTQLEGGGVTYMANLVRPNGTVLLMHLSNRADPKGAGDVLAPQPPFTTDQLTTLVTSALWW
jgi:hypothetical protein